MTAEGPPVPLDRQAQALADMLSQRPAPNYAALTVKEYRDMLASFPPMPMLDDALGSVEDSLLTGAAGPLKIRIYRPKTNGPHPLTVFFHGGCFVSCGLDTHDNICRRLAAQAACMVVAVDYRLAPEHPFPAGIDDAVAAVRWLHAHASQLGIDPQRIAVAGDSAGGTIATVVAWQLRHSDITLCHQLLLYPVTDSGCDSPSQRDFTAAPMLSSEMMRWAWHQYLPHEQARQDPRASPSQQTDLRGMAPATVITAEVDPLRDEGEAYARALVAAGIPVTQRRWVGHFHGFASLLGSLDAASQALAFAGHQLRCSFTDCPQPEPSQ